MHQNWTKTRTKCYIPHSSHPRTQEAMRMPDRLQQLVEILANLPGPVQAMLAAILIAPLRIIYDQNCESWKQTTLEALMCAALAYGVASGVDALNISRDLGWFIGILIGFFGVKKLRELVHAYVIGRGRK